MLKVNDKVWCYRTDIEIVGVVIKISKHGAKVKCFGFEFYENFSDLYKYQEDKEKYLERLNDNKISLDRLIKDIEQM